MCFCIICLQLHGDSLLNHSRPPQLPVQGVLSFIHELMKCIDLSDMTSLGKPAYTYALRIFNEFSMYTYIN